MSDLGTHTRKSVVSELTSLYPIMLESDGQLVHYVVCVVLKQALGAHFLKAKAATTLMRPVTGLMAAAFMAYVRPPGT